MSRFSSSLVVLIACTPSLLTAQTPERGATTLTARVFDQTGAPLPGAGIAFGSQAELLTTDALEGAAPRSDAEGRLALRVHLPRTVDYGGSSPPTILIAAKGKVALAMSPNDALRLPQPPTTLDLGDFILLDAITLRGRVVDAADQPLAGARVEATDALRGQYDHTLTGMMPHGRSAVLTDAKGIFALPCVPDGGVELIASKPGHYSQCLSLVGPETPLTIALRASGYVRGRALDAHGNGIATTLSLLSECGPSDAVRTAGDGTFTATVTWPGRLRLRNYPAADAAVPSILSAVLTGPQDGVELRPAGADGVRVRVRAFDAASGIELEDFHAFAAWDDRAHVVPSELLIHDGWRFVPCDAAQRVTLAPPPGQRRGHVLVAAKGRAPAVVAVDLTDADTPKDLVVPLAAEATIAGKVVDAAGRGLAGAQVWALALRPGTTTSYGQVPPIAVVTDANGSFTIGGLAAGNHVVQAFHPERLIPDVVRADVDPGRPVSGLILEMAPRWRLRGKLVGKRIEPGCYLRCLDREGGIVIMEMEGSPARLNPGTRHTQRPAEDGTFQFDGLTALANQLVLVQPSRSRLGRALEFPLGEFRAGDEVQEIDIRSCEPVRITGRVEPGDTTIPLERLLLVASAPASLLRDLLAAQRQAASGIDRAGRFALDVVPGTYELRVVDAATGVVLHKTEPFAATADGEGAAPIAIGVRAARTRVRLQSATEGGSCLAASLHVAPVEKEAPPWFGLHRLSIPSTWQGIPLYGERRDVDLWLPPEEFKLTVTNRAGYLAGGPSLQDAELASATARPSSKERAITLLVDPPPASVDFGKR